MNKLISAEKKLRVPVFLRVAKNLYNTITTLQFVKTQIFTIVSNFVQEQLNVDYRRATGAQINLEVGVWPVIECPSACLNFLAFP